MVRRKLKGLLTFEKKYFNLNVSLHQGKVLQLCSSEITPIKHQIWWTNSKWAKCLMCSCLNVGIWSQTQLQPQLDTSAACGLNMIITDQQSHNCAFIQHFIEAIDTLHMQFTVYTSINTRKASYCTLHHLKCQYIGWNPIWLYLWWIWGQQQ